MPITILDVVHALLFIFPAYCANAAPVIFGGGFPIDGGKTFLDGKPIFGSHKTFRGFLSGLVVWFTTEQSMSLHTVLQDFYDKISGSRSERSTWAYPGP